MEPSLTGDLLLLALDDRPGRPARYRTRGGPGVPLAAAELCEQLLAGREISALVLDPTEPESRRRRRVERVIAAEAGAAVERVSTRLSRDGAIAPVEHRVLGVIPRRGFAVVDVAARAAAEQRLRHALERGARPAPGEAALAVLAALSGIARAVVPPPSGRAGRREVADHLNGLRVVVGEPVAEVLVAARRVLRRSGDAGGGFVPMDGRDAYGDTGGDGAGGDGGGDGGGGGD